MIWKKRTLKPIETIARTGFLVSLTSYIVFWLADLVQPGFVSRYFSVHIFLLAAIIFALLWTRVLDRYTERHWVHALVVLALCVLVAVLTWGLGEGLEVYRLPVAVIGAVTPAIIYSLIRD